MNKKNEDNNIIINDISNNLKKIEKEKQKEKNNIFNLERCQTKLSLRKKKLNEKILNKRKIYFEFENREEKKINIKNASLKNIISKIDEEYKKEDKILELLTQIFYILEQKYNDNKFNIDDLINNNYIEKINNLIKIYINSPKIIFYITKILFISSLLFYLDNSFDDSNILYDEKEELNKTGYFVSSDKYIDEYNKILKLYLKNEEIANNMILFIESIITEQEINQLILAKGFTLNYIIESIDPTNFSDKLFKLKVRCLSKFENRLIYENNLEISLKIQKIYIDIFLNHSNFDLFKDFNKEFDENNLLYNYLKLIENTACCYQKIFVENLIKSNIIEFLIDNFINKDYELIKIIINILIDLTNAESDLGKRLINIGIIKFLIIIIKDKTFPLKLREASLVPINNVIDLNLWKSVFFEQKILIMFCDLLNDQDIKPGIFYEICYGFHHLVYYCKEEQEILNIILEEYFIIQLICKAMKQIINIKYEKIYICFEYFCSFVFELLSNFDDKLTKKIITIFLKSGGDEILDSILSSYYNVDLEMSKSEEEKRINNAYNIVDLIKEKIKIYKK